MANIAGVDLNQKKKVPYALTYIYGIGLFTALNICKQAKVDILKRVSELSSSEVTALSKCVEAYKVENDLRAEIRSNIINLISINCYRGTRHRAKLPCRGQRTHTNAQTRRRSKTD